MIQPGVLVRHPPLQVDHDGDLLWHVPISTASDYRTLCGCETNDPTLGVVETGVKPSREQLYTCPHCRAVVEAVLNARLTLRAFK